MINSMKAIIDALTPTPQPLQAVANHVTNGEACGGGRNGVPLQHGNEDGARISSALEGIASAIKIAEQYR